WSHPLQHEDATTIANNDPILRAERRQTTLSRSERHFGACRRTSGRRVDHPPAQTHRPFRREVKVDPAHLRSPSHLDGRRTCCFGRSRKISEWIGHRIQAFVTRHCARVCYGNIVPARRQTAYPVLPAIVADGKGG